MLATIANSMYVTSVIVPFEKGLQLRLQDDHNNSLLISEAYLWQYFRLIDPSLKFHKHFGYNFYLFIVYICY
jgi:hypothetical protein